MHSVSMYCIQCKGQDASNSREHFIGQENLRVESRVMSSKSLIHFGESERLSFESFYLK